MTAAERPARQRRTGLDYAQIPKSGARSTALLVFTDGRRVECESRVADAWVRDMRSPGRIHHHLLRGALTEPYDVIVWDAQLEERDVPRLKYMRHRVYAPRGDLVVDAWHGPYDAWFHPHRYVAWAMNSVTGGAILAHVFSHGGFLGSMIRAVYKVPRPRIPIALVWRELAAQPR
jgi:hypothetical protein